METINQEDLEEDLLLIVTHQEELEIHLVYLHHKETQEETV